MSANSPVSLSKRKPSINLSFDGATNVEAVGDMEIGKIVTIAIKGKLVRKSVTEASPDKERDYDPNYSSVELESYDVKLITTNAFSDLADDTDGDVS